MNKDVMIVTGAGQISMAIAPGIIVTPLAVDEFNGPRGRAKRTGTF